MHSNQWRRLWGGGPPGVSPFYVNNRTKNKARIINIIIGTSLTSLEMFSTLEWTKNN